MVCRFAYMRRQKSPPGSNLIAHKNSFLEAKPVKRFYNLEHLKKAQMLMDYGICNLLENTHLLWYLL